MSRNSQDELTINLNKDTNIPIKVRHSLDETYQTIVKQSKKRRGRVWKGIAIAAACSVLLAGIVFTNEDVKAGVYSFMNFDDKGIQLALLKGFGEEPNSSTSSKDVSLKLARYFSDNSKIGFNIEIKAPAFIRGNVEKVRLEYRLKNGDGEYISEYITDTKPLKSEGNIKYPAALIEKSPIINTRSGTAEYDIVLDGTQANFPKLNHAVLEIETINVFNSNGDLKSVDGNWKIPLGENTQKITPIIYTAKDKAAEIKVLSAISYPTSLSLTFAYDPKEVDDKVFFNNVKLVDNKGKEYKATDFSMEKKQNQTIQTTNFPISSFADTKELRLVVKGLKEVVLERK